MEYVSTTCLKQCGGGACMWAGWTSIHFSLLLLTVVFEASTLEPLRLQ